MAKPENASEVLTRIMKTSAIGHDLQHAEIYEAWRDSAGAEVARHTRVVGVRSNTLIVEVDSSPWLYELSGFHKQALVQSVQGRLTKTRIIDIDFRIARF